MKNHFISFALAIAAGSFAEAATSSINNGYTPDMSDVDLAASLSTGGIGTYDGFSFNFSQMTASVPSVTADTDSVYLTSMDIFKGVTRTEGSANTYVTIFTGTTKDAASFVGQSSSPINGQGLGLDDSHKNEGAWVSTSFDYLALNKNTTYHVFFTSTQIDQNTDFGSLTWDKFRLRLGKETDGLDNSGSVYTQGGGWLPVYNMTVSNSANVPEPASATLGVLGLAALMLRRRR